MVLSSILALVVPDPVNFVGQRAFWLAVTVSFIIEKSPGAAIEKTVHRVVGTVVGSVYGFLAYELGKGAIWSLPLFLFVWIALTSWVRTSQHMAYTGVVAGFTAAIVMLTPVTIGSADEVAFARIAYNCYGGAVVLLVTNFLFRRSAVRLARENLDHTRASLAALVVACIANLRVLSEAEHDTATSALAGHDTATGGMAGHDTATSSMAGHDTATSGMAGQADAQAQGPSAKRMRAVQAELAGCVAATGVLLRQLPALLAEAAVEPHLGPFAGAGYREAQEHAAAAALAAGAVQISGRWMLARRMGRTPGLGQTDVQIPFQQSLMVRLGRDASFAAALQGLEDLLLAALHERAPDGGGGGGGPSSPTAVRKELVLRLQAATAAVKQAFYRFVTSHLERASAGVPDTLPGSNCDALSGATMVFAVHSVCTAAARFALAMDRIRAGESRTLGQSEEGIGRLLATVATKASPRAPGHQPRQGEHISIV